MHTPPLPHQSCLGFRAPKSSVLRAEGLVRVVSLSSQLQRRLVCSTGILPVLPAVSGTGDPPLSRVSVPQVEVQLSLPIAQPGKYVLVVEYANTNALQTVGVAVGSPHLAMQQATFIFYPCVYRYSQLRGGGRVRSSSGMQGPDPHC